MGRDSRWLLLVFAVVPGFGTGCSTVSHACTLAACNQGIEVRTSYRDAGTYTLVVDVDGEAVTCTTTLPSGDPADACGTATVVLERSGGTITGIRIASTKATSVAIHATKDGAGIGDKSFAPSYSVSPGPNGPDCEPKECRLATASFP